MAQMFRVKKVYLILIHFVLVLDTWIIIVMFVVWIQTYSLQLKKLVGVLVLKGEVVALLYSNVINQ